MIVTGGPSALTMHDMATRDRKTKALPFGELMARLRELEEALERGDDLAVAKLARELADTEGPLLVTLQAVGDAAIWRRTRRPGGMTYDEIMRELRYGSRTRISDAVRRHNRRLRGEL